MARPIYAPASGLHSTSICQFRYGRCNTANLRHKNSSTLQARRVDSEDIQKLRDAKQDVPKKNKKLAYSTVDPINQELAKINGNILVDPQNPPADGDDDPGKIPDFWEGPQWNWLGFILQYLWAIGVGVAVVTCAILLATYKPRPEDYTRQQVPELPNLEKVKKILDERRKTNAPEAPEVTTSSGKQDNDVKPM